MQFTKSTILARESIKNLAKYAFKRSGLIIKRYPEDDATRRMKLLNNRNVDLLLDIGANAGQYARLMRDYGFKGEIISFEPLSEAFKTLKNYSQKDPLWSVHNYALGDSNYTTTINVAGNSYSSSLLDMLPAHENAAPESKYVTQEQIEVKTLDSLFNKIYKTGIVMMKIDVQGFEKSVLEGAKESLDNIDVLQLEMSIIPLYENEMIYSDMIIYLKNMGFELFSLENGYSDPKTGKLLQVDGIFEKVK
jgi:FkbM family methyltransferase